MRACAEGTARARRRPRRRPGRQRPGWREEAMAAVGGKGGPQVGGGAGGGDEGEEKSGGRETREGGTSGRVEEGTLSQLARPGICSRLARRPTNALLMSWPPSLRSRSCLDHAIILSTLDSLSFSFFFFFFLGEHTSGCFVPGDIPSGGFLFPRREGIDIRTMSQKLTIGMQSRQGH